MNHSTRPLYCRTAVVPGRGGPAVVAGGGGPAVGAGGGGPAVAAAGPPYVV